jgi:subtilisin family serine protease
VASFSSGGMLIADNHQYVVPKLVAPGQEVLSCVVGGGYEAWDGTSMATPIASGVAALVIEKHPDITVGDLLEALLSTCRDLSLPVERQGNGLVQVKAVDESRKETPPEG